MAGRILNQVPPTLFETLLPGYGSLSRYVEDKFGIDVSALVSLCFTLVALMGSYRYVWRSLKVFVDGWLVSAITVNSTDRLYNQIMEYMSNRIMTRSSRFLAARSRNSSWEGRNAHMIRGAVSQSDYDQTHEVNPAPLYLPALGQHRFWHRGSLLTLKRMVQNAQTNGAGIVVNNNGGNEKETITIQCYGRSPAPIKNFLRDCQTLALEQRRSMTTIHPSTGNQTWQRILLRPSRPLDTVYMDESVKTDLLGDIRDFLSPAQPRYYARRGIPYRRGYLFYGPPGTGKTSLTLALAGALGLELFVVGLSESGMTEQKLMGLFSSLPPRCIMLLEDIDTASMSRGKLDKEQRSAKGKKAEAGGDKEENSGGHKLQARKYGEGTLVMPEPEKVSLSGLLNVIDGVASQEGRLLIMTSNDPEALDEALIRPGRVDMQVHFGNLSKENARELFVRMYAEDTPEDQPSPNEKGTPTANGHSHKDSPPSEIEGYADKFYDAIPALVLTPAEVQGFLLTRRKSPQKAIAEVGDWVDSVLAAKTRGRNILTITDGVDEDTKET